MIGSRSFRLKSAVAPLAVIALATVLAPTGAEAAIFASAPKDNAASLNFKTTPGVFSGRWISRSIAISGDPKASFARLGLGTSEFDLVEQGGKITGTRPAATRGKTYDISGVAVYGPRRSPQIVLHSTSEVAGKTYDYDYFGYLMPSWNVSGAQPDTFMGTVVRTDPSAPDAAAVVVSFIATRAPEAAAPAK